jgi:hypothetical protein
VAEKRSAPLREGGFGIFWFCGFLVQA